jgi:hypothetical protein
MGIALSQLLELFKGESLSYKSFGNKLYVEDNNLYLQQSITESFLSLGEDILLLSDLSSDNLKKGQYYSFSDLDDEDQITIVFLLSSGLKKSHPDNLEFIAANSTKIINFFSQLDNGLEILKNGFSLILSEIRDNIKENKDINEIEYEIYLKYSKIPQIRSLPVTSEIRILIVKYRGESSFIKEQFAGLEDFFSLEQFQERLDNKIREFIDLGVSLGENYELVVGSITENNLITVNSAQTDAVTPLVWWRLPGEFLGSIPIEERKFTTPAGSKLLEIAGFDGTNMRTKVPFQEIKYSTDNLVNEIYENPTSFEKASVYDRKNFVNINFYPGELITYYNPTVEVDAFLWFDREGVASGPQQTVMGYYIKFIDIFSDEQNFLRDGQLIKSIGEFEEDILWEAFNSITERLFAFQENLIRYNLAKLVSEEELKDLRSLDAEEALDIAQAAADLNLQGLQGDLGEDELTEEDIQQRVQFYKQCVLLLNAQDLKQDHINSIITNLNKKDMHQGSYYNNRFYMVESREDNLSIKNKLISPSGSKIKPFMEITSDIMSALKPRLRIYKIYQVRDEDDSTNKKTVSFEFPFPSYTSTDRVNVFNGQEIDRGDGLGIKSFNFSFDGETPATSQQYISADLSLFFQSFSDFVKERVVPNGRSDGQEEKFRYVDLFVNTKSCPPDLSSTSPLNYDPQYYRIRVDVGWEPRTDDGFKQILRNRGLDPTEFNEALAVMNKSFYLNLIDHEINISDSGTVTISANYIAYIEGIMENNNVLLSAEAKQLQDEFVGKYEAERRKKNCDKDELAELRASINAIRISSRNILHQSLIEKLVKNGCMYYTQVRNKSRRDFTSRKFFHKKPDLLDSNGVAYRASIAQGNSGSPLEENNMERVSFFYLSDLVYFLLDPIYVNVEPEEQIKVILSSFSIEIPYTGDVSLNIGQIPIEIEVFTKWYKDEIIDKELDSISFLEFIKRLAFYLITDIFSEVCVDQQLKMVAKE